MRLALTVISLALAATASAQTGDVSSYWNSSRHVVRSSVNDLEYQLFVSLPVGYSAKDTTTYPVLYALDGNDTFWLIQSVTRYLGEGGATPRMIIVGVGYPDSSNVDVRRRMDLTPSAERGSTSVNPSGGAAVFLETLRRDLIPFIEKSYRTRPDRALLGHSFGGLFTVYTLFTTPDLFNRYGILSPSMWWDNHRLLGEISDGRQPRTAAAARAFVAVGADEDAGMRGDADTVTSILTKVFGEKLALASRQYPGNHQAYLPEAISPALVFLYHRRGCFDSLSTAGSRSYSVVSLPDRVEIERYVRSGSDVSGGAFQLGGPCFRYQLTADTSGRVIAALLEQNLGTPRTTRVHVRGSSIRTATTDPAEERSVDVPGPTSLFVLRFMGSIDPLVRRAPSRVGDSTRIRLVNFRRAETGQPAVIVRIAPDSVRVSHPSFELRIHVSPQLDMLGGTTRVNGAATEWLVVRQQ